MKICNKLSSGVVKKAMKIILIKSNLFYKKYIFYTQVYESLYSDKRDDHEDKIKQVLDDVIEKYGSL